MSVSLSKGGKVSLAKAAVDSGINERLSKIVVGLGWDVNKYDGGHDFDLDASVFLCGDDGKVHKDVNFVFYNNKKAPGVEHMGDNRTGAGEGDDEIINIDLDSLDPDVSRIAFAVTIFEAEKWGQTFGQVDSAYIHILDAASGVEILRYDLSEDYSVETALVVAEMYKHNGEWKFNAVGAGFQNGLQGLCNNYGISIG